MSLAEYFEKLETHDWYYEFSDDGRIFDRGHSNQLALEAISKTSEKHKKMFDDFSAYHSSGDAFGTPKLPRPELKIYL